MSIPVATGILSSKIAKPTKMAWKLLQRTIGYLKKVPMVVILPRPDRPNAKPGTGCQGRFGVGDGH